MTSQDRYQGPEPVPFRTIDLSWVEKDAGEHPLIAKINSISERLAEILGPMFWAALIISWLWAEFA